MILIIAIFISPKTIEKETEESSETMETINNSSNQNTVNVILKCAKCGNVIRVNDKFCTQCGTAIEGDNIKVEEGVNPIKTDIYVKPADFDPIYSLYEKDFIEKIILREMEKCGISKSDKKMPKDALKKRIISFAIFNVLAFILLSMIFFHYPLFTYIIGLIILIISIIVIGKYDVVSYLGKKMVERPEEDISNIVMTAKETMVDDISLKVLLGGLLGAVLLSCVIFYNPRIIYEECEGGYAVRFYTFGISNFTTATIPEEYKGKPVVELRGNTFSNMPKLKSVELPNTITQIRGQAFKNDISLEKVNIPERLEYLGGGAFYNCSKIEEIELPDTITFMGGETFKNATSLRYIKLSENIEEIRGNSFEECVSLEAIKIPDKVTRIGGHAFYHNVSLANVEITPNSQLDEIGSSAFRLCNKLLQIKIPANTYVNERAFKESPTNVLRYDTNAASYNFVDSSKYSYKDYVNIKKGEQRELSKYNDNTYASNKKIQYVNSATIDGVIVFNFTIIDENGSESYFELSSLEPIALINENIAVEVVADFVFDDVSSISVYVYYK